jgi:hypothetical protein
MPANAKLGLVGALLKKIESYLAWPQEHEDF